jgi:NTP pyrophosphatase (non-canonical NTP hydrolase)
MPIVNYAAAINDLAEDIFSISESKGFWAIDEISDFAIVPIKLALIGDEVSEALKVHRDEYDDSDEDVATYMTDMQEDDFTEELADIIIRTLDLAAGLDLKIGESIINKIEKNRDRPNKHNKRY